METETSNSGSNCLKVNQEGECYDLEILLRRPSLRMNVPRKSSQIYPNSMKTKETTCGFGCLKGEWLQSFSNRTSLLVIYGALACFYGSFNTYFYGSITTLEKRFQLSSQTIGIIASIGDFVQIIMSVILCFCNIKNYRPRWIGTGIFLVFLSTLIWSSAHFMCPNTDALYEENRNFTEAQDITDVIKEKKPIIYLSLAQILYGIGGSLFFVLGTSYLEENTKDYQTPAILNLVLALKTVGLALGYWLSSLCLKIFLSTTFVPVIEEGDPKWIGAWWFGSLIIGFLIIIPGFLIILYPSSMPKTVVRKIFKRISNEENDESNKETNKITLNSSLYYRNFSETYDILRFSIYFIYITKYVEIQYQIQASSANFTVGALTILCSAFGTVLAGSIISRYKPGIICLIAWNLSAGLLSIGCLIYYIFLGCSNYETQIKSLILQSVAISSDPKFKTSGISYADSVCDEFGQTYLSIQMIGCSEILKDNQTIVCKGTNSNFSSFSLLKTLQKGPCHADCQLQFLKFIFIFCIISFIFGSGKISNFLIHIKDSENLEKSKLLLLGIIFKLLVFLTVPILFGHFLDISCLLWNDNESQTGNCWLYDVEKIRLFFNLSAVAFAIIGIISDTLVLFSIRNIKMSYNETHENFM